MSNGGHVTSSILKPGNDGIPYAELRRLPDHPWASRRRRCFQDGGPVRRGVSSEGDRPQELESINGVTDTDTVCPPLGGE